MRIGRPPGFHAAVREQAAALGSKRYFTGKPCKHNHVCERVVKTKLCLGCDKARKKLPKNLAKNAISSQRWRDSHPENCAVATQVSKDWRAANIERAREHGRVKKTRRRAKELAASGTFTRDDWCTLVTISPRCHWCKKPWTKTNQPTHDHVIPLSKGGANSVENSVCSCSSCNKSKAAKLINPVTGQGILL